jgi:predicted RNase H-like nuclease (RuvC/YqgF family)
MESLEGTLTERVEAHISVHHPAEPEWGSPHVTTTPLSLRVENLVREVAHLEEAVREIAREVQRLSRDVDAVRRSS